MRNPTALTRLAGLTLALSLIASCGTETSSEILPATLDGGTKPEEPAAEPEAPAAEPEAPAADVSAWKVGDTMPSGIAGVPDIEILEVRGNGSGPVCGTGKSATVKYKAMLADGTVKDPGPTYTFQVGAGRVIKGWDVAIAKLRVGDSLVVLIPEGLAYPGQGNWKFEMELLSFK